MIHAEGIDMSPATPIAAHLGGSLPRPSRAEAATATVSRQQLPPRVKGRVKCPCCKSPKIRYSASIGVLDGVIGLLGMRALRCHSCYAKFHKFWA